MVALCKANRYSDSTSLVNYVSHPLTLHVHERRRLCLLVVSVPCASSTMGREWCCFGGMLVPVCFVKLSAFDEPHLNGPSLSYDRSFMEKQRGTNRFSQNTQMFPNSFHVRETIQGVSVLERDLQIPSRLEVALRDSGSRAGATISVSRPTLSSGGERLELPCKPGRRTGSGDRGRRNR